MAFQCVIVTPEQQLLDESVSQVILPADDGQIGILTNRAPLLARLGLGPIRVDLAGGQQETFLLDGGVAQMKDNKLMVLTNAGWAVKELDPADARAEYEKAVARKTETPAEAVARTRSIRRAQLKQELASTR